MERSHLLLARLLTVFIFLDLHPGVAFHSVAFSFGGVLFILALGSFAATALAAIDVKRVVDQAAVALSC